VAPARIGPPALLTVCVLAVGLLTGCGSDSGDSAAPGAGETPPPSPLVRVALEGPFTTLDPLYVRTHADRVLSRQIYDPPVAALDPPLGVTPRRRGPLIPLGNQPGSPDWYFKVRPSLEFQDGSPLNGSVIRFNSLRWLADGLAERVLPQLDAVDVPLPDRIRFQLSAPVPDLPARLSDPRFGLISRPALERYGLSEIPDGEGGSGAFAPEVLGPDRALLDAAPQWWGRDLGLGPGVEQLEFRAARTPVRRMAMLNDGTVDVADDLGPRAANLIGEQPLLSLTGEGDDVIGTTAALRGLRRQPLEQPLAEIWLTDLRP
jgi:peptide/nickel transport system substrate-binding protein